MKTLHQSTALPLAHASTLQAQAGGQLRVLAGPVWATLAGSGDLVLAAGECLALRRGQAVVVEPWQRGHLAQLAWQPAPAYGLRGRLAAWARSAQAWARRSQGCMAAGESMASSGAVQ